MVTYQRFYGPDNDIQGIMFNSATALTSSTDLTVLEGVAIFQDQIEATVDSDGTLFGVTYSEQFSTSTTDYDIYIATFSGAIAVVDAHENLAFTGDPEHLPQVVARHSGGVASSCYGVVWSDTFSSVDHDVYGNQYCTTTAVAYCGGGTGFLIGCPCANAGLTGRGCNNSSNTGGALLTSSGTSSLSSDSLQFTASGEKPTATSIFLQGTQSILNGVVFGQGVRCVGGTLKRLYTHTASGGTVSAPVGADAPVHVRSAALGDPITFGSQRFYQVYYRDPTVLGGCPSSSTFNVGNGQAVTWIP